MNIENSPSNRVKYVALLRGINVGGNNIIKMAELKSYFEEMGFSKVFTYIQSGNVIFESAENDLLKLSKKIENGLSVKFDYKSTVIILPIESLKSVVENTPETFGSITSEYKYDIIFIKKPYTADDIINLIPQKEGIDQVIKGDSSLYISRKTSNLGQSYLKKIVSKPFYKHVTIRNWKTTTKLYSIIMEED